MNNNNLTPQEDAQIRQAAGGNVTATAVARLYSAYNGTWSYNNIWGGIALVSDGISNFLRIISLDSSEMLYEQELYENFIYAAPKPFFHSFEGADAVYGLSFSDEEAASRFHEAVSAASSSSSRAQSQPHAAHAPSTPHGALPSLPPKSGPPARPSFSAGSPSPSFSAGAPSPSPPTGFTPSAQSVPSVNVTQPPKPTPPVSTPSPSVSVGKAPTPRGKGSSIGGAKKWFSKIKIFGDSSSSSEDIAISKPREFRHESHIGWDPANGFEIRNIPPQWRKLFQAAGIKKSELRDADTAKFIMDTVAEATMGENPVAAGHAPPPPAGGGAPPPPAGAPPPPTGGPPPPMGGPDAPPGAPSGGSGFRSGPPPPAGGSGMLAGLSSVKLKSAEERALPELGELDEHKQANLADTLAKAMEARRDALINADSDDAASDDEWSD